MNFIFFEGIFEVIESLTNKLRVKKKTRNGTLLLSFLVLLISVNLLIYYKDLNDYQSAICIFLAIISLIFFLSAILAFSDKPVRVKNPFEIQLKELSEETKELKKNAKSETKLEDNVFNTIQLNLNQTTEYYVINKSQARESFRISVTSIIAGLITILLGIWLIYFKEGNNITPSILSLSTGLLLEIIGGMYFHIYNKSLDQLNHFYEKLEKMQDTMLAIELTNGIKDESKKIEVQEKIIVTLIERSSNI